MNTVKDNPSMTLDGPGEDPFALTENCDYPPPSKSVEAHHNAAADNKPAEDDDDVALPTPIAMLMFTDGRAEPVYQPLAGHEHLFKPRSMNAPQTSVSSRTPTHRPLKPAPIQTTGQPLVLCCTGNSLTLAGSSQHAVLTPRPSPLQEREAAPRKQRKSSSHRQGLLKSKSLKRTRSVAQGLAPTRKANPVSDDGDDDDEQPVEVVTEESYTFYIGDIDAFKDFLRRRFDELTMKPLRGIATHWVKLLEPRRLGDWGKYHEMLPHEADTPPWWPKTVIYKEPSHLKKNGTLRFKTCVSPTNSRIELSTLAVEMMLVHRELDEIKRKGSWISKLREVARFTVQTTSADHFSSSKGAVHSEQMKSRALEQILPSIFDVAQAYEDHIMQYNLFEGSGNVDPGRGKHHTWKPIPRPVRRQRSKRPRRTVARSPDTVQEHFQEVSGDETEPDDTMNKLAWCPQPTQLRSLAAQSQTEARTPQQPSANDDSRRQKRAGDTPLSSSGPCTPITTQDDCKMNRTTSTPNSSFDQSLHGLHLGEEDLDLKPHTRTMSNQGNLQPQYTVVPYNQPMPYPSGVSDFTNNAYQPTNNTYQPTNNFANQAPTHFTHNSAGFVNPFSMFNAPPPSMGFTQYTSSMPTCNNAFQYERGMFPSTPMSFPSTPISVPMTPSDTSTSFHGLPSDFPVDPQGLHHF
ncbi:hypothetical protein N0V94_001441 [Neodidymelliopsis sp. IMI 364377]|nr:hypothetical protein N0V94_001441 [Neodidymelliopsis sp. IMI 364377]